MSTHKCNLQAGIAKVLEDTAQVKIYKKRFAQQQNA
jgi:hypothetical protein